MSIGTFLDYLGIRLNGPDAAGKKLTLNVALTDTGEEFVLMLANGSLSHSIGRQDAEASTLTMTRPVLTDVILGTTPFDDAIARGEVTVTGDGAAARELLGLFDTFEFWFNIVTP